MLRWSFGEYYYFLKHIYLYVWLAILPFVAITELNIYRLIALCIRRDIMFRRIQDKCKIWFSLNVCRRSHTPTRLEFQSGHWMNQMLLSPLVLICGEWWKCCGDGETSELFSREGKNKFPLIMKVNKLKWKCKLCYGIDTFQSMRWWNGMNM